MERTRAKKRTVAPRVRDSNISAGAISPNDGQELRRYKPEPDLASSNSVSRRHRWYDDFTSYRRYRCDFMRLTLQITFAFIIFTYTIYAYRAVETEIHPVVEDFKVTSIERGGSTVTIEGVMIKDRACVFEGLLVYGSRSDNPAILLDFQFLDSDGYVQKIRSRSKGYQTWGPWVIYLPEQFKTGLINIYSTHSCWPFWQTESKLASIPIPTEERSE